MRAIALTWVDNAGVTRVKAVPVDRLEAAEARGVGMSPVFDVYLSDDSMTATAHAGGRAPAPAAWSPTPAAGSRSTCSAPGG